MFIHLGLCAQANLGFNIPAAAAKSFLTLAFPPINWKEREGAIVLSKIRFPAFPSRLDAGDVLWPAGPVIGNAEAKTVLNYRFD